MKLTFLGCISLLLTGFLFLALHHKEAIDPKFAAGQFHSELTAVVDIPPIRTPNFTTDGDFIAPADKIIGVIVEQQAFAFPVAQMIRPTQHVVSFAYQGVDLAVTHCNISGCSRVVTTNKKAPGLKPDMLHVGGLQADGKMVLLLDETRYSQLSPDLPLEDYQFQVTSKLDWQMDHPNTLYFHDQSTNDGPMAW